ncbi:MAG TPA: prolyl oligopeptidase family serine peptidase [Solirubrobacterales bacterium]|nr:prolyl oligopeptidase family serine peptidase [Solirubrobacterales bacterium]
MLGFLAVMVASFAIALGLADAAVPDEGSESGQSAQSSQSPSGGSTREEPVGSPTLPPDDSQPAPLPPVGGARAERHLIVIPGGGFTRYDPFFEMRVMPAARAAGFTPHFLRYQLNDFIGAYEDARTMARDLAARYGAENIFAFGSSAGGTLATLLAGEARVAAGVSSSGLYDFENWPWVEIFWGTKFFEDIRLAPLARHDYSPINRPLLCPVMAMHGVGDPIVSVFQVEDFEFAHTRATARLYPGGHGLYRRRPESVRTGLRWLHKVARIQGREQLQSAYYSGERSGRYGHRRLRRLRYVHGDSLCQQAEPTAVSRLSRLSRRR